MTDIHIRVEGKAGRITLQRPKALNALTYNMCLSILEVLDIWKNDSNISLVIVDAEGDKAFCAGGDIADMYYRGLNGDFGYGQQYWRDEYRMNATIDEFPKPYISFLQGYVMGGGVGLGCHGSHRIVGNGSRVAMPECGIGLIPDVGGSYLLAKGPGHIGEYLGMTGTRMNGEDAIFMGFADHFIDENFWCDLKQELSQSGSIQTILDVASKPTSSKLASQQETINNLFNAASTHQLMDAMIEEKSAFSDSCLKKMSHNSPLSMACAFALIRMQRQTPNLVTALSLEYRYVHRSLEMADFLEGIRAKIIDKDEVPHWRHSSLKEVSEAEVQSLLSSLGGEELLWSS